MQPRNRLPGAKENTYCMLLRMRQRFDSKPTEGKALQQAGKQTKERLSLAQLKIENSRVYPYRKN